MSQKLFIAILERAYKDIVDPVTLDSSLKRRDVQQDALEWINYDENDNILTFRGVCEILKLNHKKLRKQILSEVSDGK